MNGQSNDIEGGQYVGTQLEQNSHDFPATYGDILFGFRSSFRETVSNGLSPSVGLSRVGSLPVEQLVRIAIFRNGLWMRRVEECGVFGVRDQKKTAISLGYQNTQADDEYGRTKGGVWVRSIDAGRVKLNKIRDCLNLGYTLYLALMSVSNSGRNVGCLSHL